MTTCENCESYLRHRRKVLLPYIGLWVQRNERNIPPARLVERLVTAHHRRFCS